MRAKSRSSIRWGVATAVAVTLILGASPGLAGSNDNGRLVAAHPAALPDDEGQQAPGAAIDVRETQASRAIGTADDGSPIGDDADVASVDGSANDAAAAPVFGGSY